MKTIELTTTELRDRTFGPLPDGAEVPDTYEVDGITFTAEQASAIVNAFRSGVKLRIQRIARTNRLAVSVSPSHVWARFEPDGSFGI